MLVVIGIIIMVAAMSIPMMAPFLRTRKLEQASGMVKGACIIARSKAIEQRKMYNVTLLTDERQIFITEYEALRDLILTPGKAAGDANTPFAAHWLGNYADDAARRQALTQVAKDVGEAPMTLPEGCDFFLGADAAIPNPGWTYVFLPNGSAWTIPPANPRAPANPAETLNDKSAWSLTTYTSGGKLAGPQLLSPDRKYTDTLIVYALTGQAVMR